MKKYLALFGMLLAVACGSDDAATTGSTTPETTTAATVPGDMVLSSPTATSSASTSISKSIFLKQSKPGDATADDYNSKKAALQKLIKGDDECGFTLSLPTVSSPACYGPTVNYQQHASATGNAVDADTADRTNPEDDDGQLPVGDTGIWNETEGTQACSAAKMTELVEKVAARVDTMISIFGTLACAGKKAKSTLPGVGETLDLASALSSNVSISGLTFGSAKVERLANASDGNAVYKSTIAMTFTFPNGGTQTGTMILKHIPTAADNSTYRGKVSMKVSAASGQGGNCQAVNQATGQSGVVFGGVIMYEKLSATQMRYEVRYAEFCGSTAAVFDSDNNLPLNDQANSQTAANPDGWADNGNYMRAEINPQNGTGTVAYAWQAGALDDNTRVFNITTTLNSTSGVTTGTAFAGFGPDIGASSGVGAIDRFICNWAGPSNSHTGIQKAQRQEITKANGATEFTVSSSNITYSPTNTCDLVAGSTFLYEAVNGGNYGAVDGTNTRRLSHTNNRTSTTSAVTNNFVSTPVTFTLPTAPTDVGG